MGVICGRVVVFFFYGVDVCGGVIHLCCNVFSLGAEGGLCVRPLYRLCEYIERFIYVCKAVCL